MGYARTKADPDALIAALHESGQAALGLGKFESARKDFDEELEVNRRNQSANPIGEATALDDLAELSNATWDYEEALKTLGKSQALCDQKSGDGRVLNARILQDRGEAEIGIGEFEKAEEPIQAALKTFTSEGAQRETLATEDELARSELLVRKMVDAKALFTSVLEQRKSILEKNTRTRQKARHRLVIIIMSKETTRQPSRCFCARWRL